MSGRAVRPALGLVLAALAAAGCARSTAPHGVVIVTLDTTRADHLSCYGYERQTSPELDRLAAESVVYTRAVATSSWTLPAHASLFTAKFTTSHGARYDAEGPLSLSDGIGGGFDRYRVRGLAEGETTLAGILSAAGYATGAVVAGPWMKRVFGLDSGFEHYDDQGIDAVTGRRAEDVTDAALRWLDGCAGRPFFLFVNYYDPHSPYAAPEPFTLQFLEGATREEVDLEDRKRWIDLYDGEIRYMDHELGRLLGGLKARGLYADTLIVVTADHGELFGEHGEWGHGRFLYEQDLHVPLIVRRPGAAPQRRAERVQLVDVMPLVLDALDLPLPEGVQGGVPPAVGHPILAEVYPLEFVSQAGDWRALYQDDLKMIWNSKGNHLLFDLSRDPREAVDLYASEAGRFAYLATLAEVYLASLPRPGAAPARELDAETVRALRNLGYVR